VEALPTIEPPEYFSWPCTAAERGVLIKKKRKKIKRMDKDKAFRRPTPRQSFSALITTPMPCLKSLNLSAAVL